MKNAIAIILYRTVGYADGNSTDYNRESESDSNLFNRVGVDFSQAIKVIIEFSRQDAIGIE